MEVGEGEPVDVFVLLQVHPQEDVIVRIHRKWDHSEKFLSNADLRKNVVWAVVSDGHLDV